MVNMEPHGQRYRPALTIRRFGSRGKRFRVFGTKTQRVHHLMSGREDDFFRLFDWSPSVIDIREQYPIRPTRRVRQLARELSLKPPSGISDKHPWTSDFVLTLRDGLSSRFLVVSVKPANLLRSNARTRELLHLERACWAECGIRCLTVTERSIPRGLLENLKWLAPLRAPNSFYRDEPTERDQFLESLRQLLLANPYLPLAVVCRTHDLAWKVATGTSLSGVRYALAQRHWTVSLSSPINPTWPTSQLGGLP